MKCLIVSISFCTHHCLHLKNFWLKKHSSYTTPSVFTWSNPVWFSYIPKNENKAEGQRFDDIPTTRQNVKPDLKQFTAENLQQCFQNWQKRLDNSVALGCTPTLWRVDVLELSDHTSFVCYKLSEKLAHISERDNTWVLIFSLISITIWHKFAELQHWYYTAQNSMNTLWSIQPLWCVCILMFVFSHRQKSAYLLCSK